MTTSGDIVVNEDANDKLVKLTKEQCDVKLNEFMASGVTASRMRAVPDVGQPYTTPKE